MTATSSRSSTDACARVGSASGWLSPRPPSYLKGRVQRDESLPIVELTPPQQEGQQGDERVRGAAAFVVGIAAEEGLEEEEPKHLPRDLFKELLGYMMHAWADKGPEEGQQQQA